MAEEPTTPDPVELTSIFFATMDGEWDFDALGVLSVALWEDGCPRGSDGRVQARHLQAFEWAQGEIVRITGYRDSAARRAAAERLAVSRE